MREMPSRKVTLPQFAILVAGFILGNVVHSDSTEYKVIHVKDRVEVPVKADTIYTTPKACVDMAALTKKIHDASVKINNNSTDLIDLMAEGRIAVFERSTNKFNDLETKARVLKSETVDAVQALSEAEPIYKLLREECEKQVS